MRLASILLTLALIAIPAASPGAEPFEIYADLPLTGQVAFIGSQTAKALAALEGYVNGRGGINGRPIKIVISDDQSSPQVAVQIMNQYLAKKPAIVFGGLLAAICNASTGVLKDDGPVLYCYTPGVHPSAGSWVYSSGYSTVDIFAAGMRYFRERGLTKIAIISTTDASGQEAAPTMAGILARPENRSIVLTDHEQFAVTDLSVTAQLERIKNSGAQMIITWVSGTPFGTVLRGLRDGGLSLPILSSQANMNYTQLENYRSIIPNSPVYFPGVPALVPDAIADRGVRRAVEQFNAAMKTQNVTRPDVGAALAWDNMLIVVDAYKHLGFNATPAQMRDYINKVGNWQGIYGIVDYAKTPQRGMSADWCMIVRWDPTASRFVAVSKPGGSPVGQ
jgi:branched-chain amino acid transport system substrate-binding protein